MSKWQSIGMVGNGQLFDITSLIWLILIGQKLDITFKALLIIFVSVPQC